MPEQALEEHQNPSVRVCEVIRPSQVNSCGFHLTRTKWDPYPWVCGVDDDSPAKQSGLQVGDCVLEVNGEDVLGLRVGEIATKVRAKTDSVTMLLWNSGVDSNCDPESLCCGPMPSSLQRLSTCMSAILSVLECPVCLLTIPPPAHQCSNGHLICVKCRLQSERCPICRLRYSRSRSLLADQVYNSLTDAFNLRGEPTETRSAKLKQRLVGKKKVHETNQVPILEINSIIVSPKNRFLSKIMGKSSSVENLSSNNNSPKYLSAETAEFTPNLKTKSLSSNEIFNRDASSLSRCSSNNLDVDFSLCNSNRSSCESLNQRMSDASGRVDIMDDGALYHCPSTSNCPVLMKRPDVFRHLQDSHNGPLIQYYRPNIVLSLPPELPPEATITITCDGSIYFLKIVPGSDGDFCVWLWILGGKFKAENVKVILTVRGDSNECPELSFKSSVYSLATTSWEDVVTSKHGVLLTRDVLLANFRGRPVRVEVKVASNTTVSAAV